MTAASEQEAIAQWNAMIDAVMDEFGICRAIAVHMHMTAIGSDGQIEGYCEANGLPAAPERDVEALLRAFVESGGVSVSTKDWRGARTTPTGTLQ